MLSIFTYIISGIISVLLALLLMVLKTPKYEELRSYNISRMVISIAYLVMGIANIVQVFLKPGPDDNMETAIICLIVSSFHVLFLTFSLITLIDAYHVTKRKCLKHALPILVFSVLSIVFTTMNLPGFKILFYLFLVFYVGQLIFYSRLFYLKEKKFIDDSKNYFSENEIDRIKWVRTVFLSFLIIGILALFVVLMPQFKIFELLFTAVCTIVYLYYGIQYVNYVHSFYVLMPVVANQQKQTPAKSLA